MGRRRPVIASHMSDGAAKRYMQRVSEEAGKRVIDAAFKPGPSGPILDVEVMAVSLGILQAAAVTFHTIREGMPPAEAKEAFLDLASLIWDDVSRADG